MGPDEASRLTSIEPDQFVVELVGENAAGAQYSLEVQPAAGYHHMSVVGSRSPISTAATIPSSETVPLAANGPAATTSPGAGAAIVGTGGTKSSTVNDWVRVR